MFDGMTTHVVSRRFSAQETLDFFRENIESQSGDILGTPVALRIDYETVFDTEVYWSKLTPPLRAHWSRFRTPPLPRWWHVLNWLMGIPVCGRIIEFVRRVLRIQRQCQITAVANQHVEFQCIKHKYVHCTSTSV